MVAGVCDGSRHRAPDIAVLCSSLPLTLISVLGMNEGNGHEGQSSPVDVSATITGQVLPWRRDRGRMLKNSAQRRIFL